MNKPWLTPVLICLVLWILISCKSDLPVDYVDPFICTEGDHGQWLPAALVPFGLVELCPDTWPGSLTADGDLAHSGYDFSDEHIRGFSHLHHPSSGGTNISDRAGLLSVVPFSGIPADSFFINPVLKIDKSTEKAEAGYYSVHLPEDNILAELTATVHSGIHRYTFNGSESNKIFIYEGNRGGATGISCRQVDGNSLEGSIGNKYFVIRFNKPVEKIRLWNGSRIIEGNMLEKQDNGGIICEFNDPGTRELLVKTVISLSSVDAARKNLDIECNHWNFEKVRANAADSWNEILSAIKVEGRNHDDKVTFYTALYHTCFLPVNQTDTDGTYPGLDQQLHRAEGYIHYDGFAFWDSFRTKYPLYSLFIPGIYSDIVTSLRDLYEQADNWGSSREVIILLMA